MLAVLLFNFILIDFPLDIAVSPSPTRLGFPSTPFVLYPPANCEQSCVNRPGSFNCNIILQYDCEELLLKISDSSRTWRDRPMQQNAHGDITGQEPYPVEWLELSAPESPRLPSHVNQRHPRDFCHPAERLRHDLQRDQRRDILLEQSAGRSHHHRRRRVSDARHVHSVVLRVKQERPGQLRQLQA